MSDFEIKIDITRSTKANEDKNDDEKRYTNFIRKSSKLFKLRDKKEALEQRLEKLMGEIAILEEFLLDVLESP
jgi:hypothetical protein